MTAKPIVCATVTLVLALCLISSAVPAMGLFSDANRVRDVCVMGAGAAGMSAAAFLKDAGKDVLLIESSSYIGGHCDTIRFSGAPSGWPDWIDVGVQAFPNTTSAGEAGLGPFAVDSIEFTRRFAGPYSVVPIDPANNPIPTYRANLATGAYYGMDVSAPPTPEFLMAMGNLMAQLSLYPWLSLADIPDPIPAPLLVPFSQFVTANALEPLVASVFNPVLFLGGMGDFSQLTTLHALLNLSPLILRVFTAPNSAFAVYNGCAQIYDGIKSYLGSDNVVVNAKTLSALRLPTAFNVPVVLLGVIDPPSGPQRGFVYQCKKLVVAFPPVLDDSLFLNMDAAEIAAFAGVKTRAYFTGAAAASGPVATGTAFTVLNARVNNTTPYNQPPLPALMSISRGLPYGPAQIQSFSQDASVDTDAMRDLTVAQAANVPASLLSQTNVTHFFRHDFQPHWPASRLAASPNPYTRLASIQGRRNTYYIGSLKKFALTVLLWDDSYRFVQDYF